MALLLLDAAAMEEKGAGAKGEEAITERLRQLTEHTRRVRKELEQMIGRDAFASGPGVVTRLPKSKPR